MTKVTQISLDDSGELSRKRIHLREISGDADQPLETVGQDLRAGRLRRGDDLASVSRALKIRKDHLEALEEDRFDALPGRAYAIGFVRTYSDYLGLDPVQCVERFKQEIAGRGDGALPAATLPAVPEERSLPHGWIVIAAVVIALIIFGVYRLTQSADSLVNQPVAAVPQRLEPPAPKIVPKPQAAPVQTAPAATTPASPLANTETPGAITPPVPGAAPAAPPLPQGQVYGANNKNARVVLRVRQATKILVEDGDGKVFINRILQPGDTYNVPLVEGVTLTAQNGNAVELDLDGQAMGDASKTSDAVEALPLDPQSVADHANQ